MNDAPRTPELLEDIEAYESMRAELELAHMGEWAVVYGRELIGTYESFDAAAQEAVRRFGRGPYLIRQIGIPPRTMPVSVLYQKAYAAPAS